MLSTMSFIATLAGVGSIANKKKRIPLSMESLGLKHKMEHDQDEEDSILYNIQNSSIL